MGDLNTLDFGGALSALREGKSVIRKGWNAHHKLGLQIPNEYSANTAPYIYMVIGNDAADMQGKRLPWVASHTDLLATDWEVIS